MSIQIKFDQFDKPQPPTFVLANRDGHKLGRLPATNIAFKDCLNAPSELSFSVHKTEDGSIDRIWDKITDFKLLWCREWNAWFEIYVELSDKNGTHKNISATSLGDAELSQINLYDVEINTESDIARDDYEPTVLFNDTNANASLLSRILEKCPHYQIGHVDTSIKNIQRTFQFDGCSIADAFQDISEEINCLIRIDCYSDADGKIIREVNAYDLEAFCLNCGKRGNFDKVCSHCGSSAIKNGYGKDTGIFISTDNLAEEIVYDTDEGSVKNCFRLEAGDDLMTATIRNCNPDGSGYLWYISDDVKSDMSDDLVSKLNEYNALYDYYQNMGSIAVDTDKIEAYNQLIDKYRTYSDKYVKIQSSLFGFPELMETYYNVVDFGWFLTHGLMPSSQMSNTDAQEQAGKLTASSLSPVAVKDLAVCSATSADSAVLSLAKVIVDGRYQVKIGTSSFANYRWIGNFVVTSYSDDEDSATSNTITIEINDDYERFLKQKINVALNRSVSEDDVTDVIQLFQSSEPVFRSELVKYCLTSLKSLREHCQTCLDIMIEQGVANNETWANKNPNMYEILYVNYYRKLGFIERELKLREEEAAVIFGIKDENGDIVEDGLQTILEHKRDFVRDGLDFERFLGKDLLLEFSAYRREDTYKNENYISDGLSNAEIFQMARSFLDEAQKEIFKSSTLQHSISGTLKNLLVMEEFRPIVDGFDVGNWLRVRVDGAVYKLRLLEYSIDFSDISNVDIVFSDVMKTVSGTNDVESILNQASSMATTYSTITRQAQKGERGNAQLNDWVENGLSLTKVKIVDNTTDQNVSWDNHGILCRERLPLTGTYDGKQLKIINRGLYLTEDNWETASAGIGDFTFWNPKTKQFEEGYGVVAHTLVGNLILSEQVGIYNSNNSITLDEKGFTITADITNGNNQTMFKIERKELDSERNERTVTMMEVDSTGNLILNGSARINTSDGSNTSTLENLGNNNIEQRINNLETGVINFIHENIYGYGGVYNTVTSRMLDMYNSIQQNLETYKSDIGQYMEFGNNGLTLGASSSSFKTVIDNSRIAFLDGDDTVAYISNKQLYIPTAVIESGMLVGKFLFMPRSDDGFSIVWCGD